jgi:GNAT superfamily N-acetyltransferase
MTRAFHATLRASVDEDIGFVVDGWMRSYHDGSAAVRRVPFARYKPVQREVIRGIMLTGATVVAADPDDGALWGFAAGHLDEGECVLDYVYVTQLRRRAGIASALVSKLGEELEARVVSYSHHTSSGEAVLGRRLGLRFNPFSLVRYLHHAHHSNLRAGGHPDRPANPPVVGRG